MENIENMETIADINSPLNGNNLGTDMNITPENDSTKKGRVSGAGAYTSDKNLFQLSVMEDHSEAYDAGEGSNEFYSVLGKRNRSGNIDNFFKLHYVCTP